MRRMRNFAVLAVLVAAVSGSAAPPKKAAIAPPAVAHSIALFLNDLSNDGKRQVTFRANAMGTRFFFEESSGVTVYRFANGQYVRETFLAGAKLSGAMKRYASR
jgi:hypothetical protein